MLITSMINSSGRWARSRRASNWTGIPTCSMAELESKRRNSSTEKSSKSCGTTHINNISRKKTYSQKERKSRSKYVSMISSCTTLSSSLSTAISPSKNSSRTTSPSLPIPSLPSTRLASSTSSSSLRNSSQPCRATFLMCFLFRSTQTFYLKSLKEQISTKSPSTRGRTPLLLWTRNSSPRTPTAIRSWLHLGNSINGSSRQQSQSLTESSSAVFICPPTRRKIKIRLPSSRNVSTYWWASSRITTLWLQEILIPLSNSMHRSSPTLKLKSNSPPWRRGQLHRPSFTKPRRK